MSEITGNSKKYKHTKTLLKIAKREGGYRNKDIAVKAGLRESSTALVSQWISGKALATERQMAYFINNYEHIFKRQHHHLFYSETLVGGTLKPQFIKLAGEVVFKYQIKIPPKTICNKKTMSIYRILVLNENSSYHLWLQYRAGLFELTQREENGERMTCFGRVTVDQVVHSDHEEGNWYCKDLHQDINFDALVVEVQKFVSSLINGNNLFDYLIKKTSNAVVPTFNPRDVYTFELAFYQKMLSLGLQSKHFPF